MAVQPATVTPDTAATLVAAQVSEKQFQAQVVAAARLAGWLVYHVHDSRRSEAGFPDLVLCHPQRRRLLFRELKSLRGRVRQEQRLWLWVLRQCGQDARVWRPDQWSEIRRELGYVE